ncbi:MAG: sensor domain-containing diguanylate cyclase, partial [Pseudomonadales bacterium]
IERDSLAVIKVNRYAAKLLKIKPVHFKQLELLICKQLGEPLQQMQQGMTFNYSNRSFNVTASHIDQIDQAYTALHLTHKYPAGQNLDFFFALLDNLGAYVFCKDRDYKYTYANQLVCELFNLPLEQIIGYDDHHFFGTQTADHLQQVVDKVVIEEGRVGKQEELNYIPHLDEYRHYLSVKKPLYDSQGELDGLFGISIDITEQKKMQAKNRENEQKLSTILDNAGAYIYIKDSDCRFKYVNRRTQELFQRTAEQIIGRDNTELLGQEQGEEFSRTDRLVFKNREKVSCIETFTTKDATYYYWTVKIPLWNDDGQIDSYIGISTDITEQKMLENDLRFANKALNNKIEEVTALKDKMQEYATLDTLTGLLNRRAFEEQSRQYFDNRRRAGFSLLMIDIDHFKEVNDNYGHQCGDQVLSFIAKTIAQECRRSDLLCRFGGEEFLLLMPHTDKQSAFIKAEWIRQQVSVKSQHQWSQIAGMSISIGVAANEEALPFEQLYQRVDRALYSAKAKGRNCSVLWESEQIQR